MTFEETIPIYYKRVLFPIKFIDLDTKDCGEKQSKLLKQLREFEGDISRNHTFIPNYGDRYRYDEVISTSFVESTVNQVISKRMVKKQQMRWSKKGVHLLLQIGVVVGSLR